MRARPLLRIIVVAGLVFLMELARQSTHLHRWFQRDLANAGVSGVSPDLFSVPSSAVPIWNLWLVVLVACFLIVSDLYREKLGQSWSASIRAGTVVWMATFGMAWLSFLAFGLVSYGVVLIALAEAWIESQVVAAVAVRWPAADRAIPRPVQRRSVGRRSLVNVRPLDKQDLPQVAQWNVQLHEDEGSPPLSVDAAAKRLRRWFEDGTFQGAIFLGDGHPVGYVLYEHRPVHADQRAAHRVYVRQFFISRESRREGTGTAAFETFVRKLVPKNVNVVLEVKESNSSGQRFWESLSFKPIGVAYELDRQDDT